ncbi:MAG: hypothetical protein ACJ751_11445 [Niastella sp.]|uniref:hypothetical protein n=1 Tax=Niastella sp. TaxID=1869183 RepID=UPI00389A8FD1
MGLKEIMEVLKKIAEELFGNEFQCKTYKNGITLAAKDNSKGFSFGLISSPGSFQVREKIFAMKRFEEVEAILQPLLKKYKMPQGDFEQGVYGVNFISTIKKAMPIQEIPGVDSSFIANRIHIDSGNEAQIRQILIEFKKAIEYQEEEFINRYKTLKQVYEAQEQMTPDERGVFFSEPGPIRFLAIEALLNPSGELDSKFEETINDYQAIEKKYPTEFKNYDKVTMELLKYFKGGKA